MAVADDGLEVRPCSAAYRLLATPYVVSLAARPLLAVAPEPVDTRLGLPPLAVLPAGLQQGLVAGPPDGLDLPDVAAGVAVAEDVPRLAV